MRYYTRSWGETLSVRARTPPRASRSCHTHPWKMPELCSKRGDTSPQVGAILLVKERDEEGQHKGRFGPAFVASAALRPQG